MKRHVIRGVLLFCCVAFSSFGGCREKDKGKVVTVPKVLVQGYDLAAPKKFIVSEALREISGICLLRGNPDTMYAIEDETGKLFVFHLGDGKFPSRKFGKHGDYEDVTILDEKEFVVLRSDGSLFVFPTSFVRTGDIRSVRSYEHILPGGEYEGLFGDKGGRLIALCKN